MTKPDKVRICFTELNVIILSSVLTIFGQYPQVSRPPAQLPSEDNTWWYVTLFILTLALVSAVLWMLGKRKERAVSNENFENYENFISETDPVDAEKEMEWFRKHGKAIGKSPLKSPNNNFANNLPQTKKVLKRQSAESEEKISAVITERELKDKIQALRFSQLPISKIQKLEPARPFSPLLISNDEALLSAIEQTQEEYEEDEEVRELAVKILARFKTRNSVEALSQVALYDLSSNLRSKAVSVLADFDHESVFETILLACADPTREVRAAAARGLFRLSFDRSDAWTRITETNDEFRMRQAARAAMEANLVTRSLDRLIHQDYKIAYEAFTLLTLMIKANETKQIFEFLRKSPDDNLKLGFLRVVEIVGDERVVPKLQEMAEVPDISKELKDRIEEVIKKFELVAA